MKKDECIIHLVYEVHICQTIIAMRILQAKRNIDDSKWKTVAEVINEAENYRK